MDDFNTEIHKDEDGRKKVRMTIRYNDVKIRRSNGLDDPKWERDIAVICCKYFATEAIFDILANLPILVYYFTNDFKNEITEEEIDKMNSGFVFYCYILKFLRFFHIYSVLQSLKYLVDELSDYFYLQRYMFVNILRWMKADLKLLLSLHYLACGWIYIEITKAEKGLPRVEFS